MSSGPPYEVLWTKTALQMLEELGDRRVLQQLYEVSKRLASDPEKQGKALREGLFGFRSLRAVGQRHRLVYSVSIETHKVFVVAAGLRREGARDDIYALAERLIRLGLAPSPPAPKPKARIGNQRQSSRRRKRKAGK